MSVSRDVLLDAIESGFSLMPEVPGKLEKLTIPGIRGRVTPFSHPFANMVSAATLTSDNADATIRQAIDFFARQNKVFSWVIGPRTTPADLGTRLRAAGLAKLEEMAGMSLTDLNTPIQSNPAVRIREMTADDTDAASRTHSHAFPIPQEFARLFIEVLFLVRDRLKTRLYLAFLDGIDEPVASATTVFLPNQPIIRLGGATTVPEHRGKGIYSSLVARRLADARDDGAEAAVIEAIRTTSAPVCRKLGFTEICGLELYAWTPESEQKD
jgi:GNAT superfamily N-acetyltransferase